MNVILNTKCMDDYRTFLKIKSLPRYSIRGHKATFPNEYAAELGMKPRTHKAVAYEPNPAAFDYQRDISGMAITKRKFAIFAEPGRGKTLMFLDYARHCLRVLPKSRCVLIVSPLMVIPQTISECGRFFDGDLEIEHVHAGNLQAWLNGERNHRLGIVNYEAFRDRVKPGDIGALIGDETSLLKSAYGKFGRRIIDLGKGLDWKLANTGTPAPNDRIEYANHALLLDQFPTVNAFLARYFVNRGQTDNRWELKPHALEPFYRSLSHWSFFLSDPATYGWKDHAEPLPPIHTHFHHVELTKEQEALTMKRSGQLIATRVGGITGRSSWGQIAKGYYRGKPVTTNKPGAILRLCDSWPDESTIIWCLYNEEQKILERVLPDAGSIAGDTPLDKRMEMINAFKAGSRRILISKAKILGFGLNLQKATRQVFSGLQDSYEMYYQAVKRSNRVGSVLPLNVHIPLTDIEEPMVATVMRKAKMVEQDTIEQERIFKEAMRWNR